MIIVTGNENTGKSTLVNHLSKTFGIPIAKRYSPLPPKDKDDWFNWCWRQLEDNKNEVYDRFFIDELVYGPVMRGGYLLPVDKMATLSGMMLLRQPLYIYTHVPKDVILKDYGSREQYIGGHHIASITAKFREVNATWPVSCLKNKARFCYLGDPNYSRIDLIVGNYLREGSI